MQAFRSGRDERGAQIVEFAVVLPLLAVLILGIMDFGQAFAIRQKLTFAARDAARFGSSEPTNDLTQPVPVSVTAIRDLADADLLAAHISDCALGPIQPATGLQWTATGTCPNTATFTLTIDRGFVTTVAGEPQGGGQPLHMIFTHVTMSYPFKWHLSSLVPGATSAGTTQLQTDAVAPNQD